MTDAEIVQVSSQLGARDRAFFVLGVRTGFRVSELLSLRIADVVNAG
jgi:integrase